MKNFLKHIGLFFKTIYEMIAWGFLDDLHLAWEVSDPVKRKRFKIKIIDGKVEYYPRRSAY